MARTLEDMDTKIRRVFKATKANIGRENRHGTYPAESFRAAALRRTARILSITPQDVASSLDKTGRDTSHGN